MTDAVVDSSPSLMLPKNEPLVRLRGIKKSFGSRAILDGVDLDVYAGQAIAVIGPSGTGKSTIFRIISGLMAPDAGEVWVGDQRREGTMDETDQREPVNIRLVFQQSALFDSLSVAENIGFSLFEHSQLSHGEIMNLVNDALDRVGLPNIGDRYPAELSGGMRKRVSFARAVIEDPSVSASEPEIILYDEPTAGLDPIASTIVEDMMRDLSTHGPHGSTYMVVTHQDSTIRRTADQVIFLYDGKVRWQG
ncbi:MAG: ATP-binding cassette domain-containing protein, partial [Cyanobacteria bacterium P01_F01_bin.153]